MSVVLRTEGLTRRFGGILAVSDISIELAMHRLHAVIGPNGAGKSTLVNLLSGDLTPTDGAIWLGNTNVTHHPDWRRARLGIGRTFQRTNLMREMTVLENARLAAQAAGVRGCGLLRTPRQAPAVMEAAQEALHRVGLDGHADRIVGTMSHGALRLLEIALALATCPKVLLLDEPLAGLGTEETGPVADLLRQLARSHAVLLIEHDMNVVFSVADTITVMVEGRVLTTGTPAEIKASTAVRDAYLGQPMV